MQISDTAAIKTGLACSKTGVIQCKYAAKPPFARIFPWRFAWRLKNKINKMFSCMYNNTREQKSREQLSTNLITGVEGGNEFPDEFLFTGTGVVGNSVSPPPPPPPPPFHCPLRTFFPRHG